MKDILYSVVIVLFGVWTLILNGRIGRLAFRNTILDVTNAALEQMYKDLAGKFRAVHEQRGLVSSELEQVTQELSDFTQLLKYDARFAEHYRDARRSMLDIKNNKKGMCDE